MTFGFIALGLSLLVLSGVTVALAVRLHRLIAIIERLSGELVTPADELRQPTDPKEIADEAVSTLRREARLFVERGGE